MSLKFLSGLQDFLGIYDSSSNSQSQVISSAIPPTGLFSTPTRAGVKHNTADLNQRAEDDSKIRICSHDRTVRFGEELITGYSAAPSSPFHHEATVTDASESSQRVSSDEILSSYRHACEYSKIVPSVNVEKQIGYMHSYATVRQELLTLKGERISHAQMEALEEIFKRVQFDVLDFEYTFLNDDTTISLAEMLEFYDSAQKLNLSFNRDITSRGWIALFRAVKHCSSLQFLNLRYTSIEKAFGALCRVIRNNPAPALVCLHLENVSLSGKNLNLLSSALKQNNVLKELYLGENSLQPQDMMHLQALLEYNTSLQMLDLRNNEIGDVGLRTICTFLRSEYAKEHSALSAIVLWNNRLTGASMDYLCVLLCENHHVETLNIGNNNIGLDGIQQLRRALTFHGHLHRLGLQNTKLNCEAVIVLAECLADNTLMVRVDLRDNPGVGSAGLLALHSAMKLNTSITLMNLDQLSSYMSSNKIRSYQDEFQLYYEEIGSFCERNKQRSLASITVNTSEEDQQPKAVEDKDSEQDTTSLTTNDSTIDSDTEQEQPERVSSSLKKIARSSSLTCSETVSDIHERLKEMTGSTHSLDEAANKESMTTIKKTYVTTHEPLSKTEWSSLPSIPQALAETTTPTTPVVRKLRRFSVSPSSSTFDVSTCPAKKIIAPRPSSLEIQIPSVCEDPSSVSAVSTSLPEFVNICNEKESKQENKQQQARSSRTPDITPLETDEERRLTVNIVVNDLINYIVYEESSAVERKASLLLGVPPAMVVPSRHLVSESPLATPSTPSRVLDPIEDFDSANSDEHAVQSVVRGLVREVLLQEKVSLQSNLERRRRKRLDLQSLCSDLNADNNSSS